MQEDIDYNFNTLAIDDVKQADVDAPNVSILRHVLKYVNETIESYNTVDRLNPRDTKFTSDQQIQINKQIIIHLRDVQTAIESKVKELRNG